MHRYFVFAGFSLLGILFLLMILIYHKKGFHLIGTPSIEKFYFFSGKFALFTPWGLFLFKAISPKSGYIMVPQWMSWAAVGFLWTGSLILLLAMYTLRESLRIGLPQGETNLKTRGIYHYSRNPIYAGAFLISFGSCLYFPDLVNIFFILYGFYMHHRIILSEEKFLEEKFKAEWKEYRLDVRRYL